MFDNAIKFLDKIFNYYYLVGFVIGLYIFEIYFPLIDNVVYVRFLSSLPIFFGLIIQLCYLIVFYFIEKSYKKNNKI